MKNMKRNIVLFALALSYSSVYLIVYLKYLLYNPMLETFGVTNQQLGYLMSMYAIGCMLLYIPGGYVADKFSTKKILVFSLAGNGLVCFGLAASMSYTMALIAWFLFAITSAFAFWAALVKGVLSLSTEENSAGIYSIYYFMGGVLSTVLNGILVWLFARSGSEAAGLRMVIMAGGAFSILSAVMVQFLYEDVAVAEKDESDKFQLRHVKPLLKSPILWVLSICVMSVYGLRVAGSTYFNPYLVNVKGFNVEATATIGLIRTYVFPLLSPLAGLIITKLLKSTSKWFMITFAILAGLFGLVLVLPEGTGRDVILLLSLLPGAVSAMMYGVMFSIIREAKIPVYLMGTAIGIVSIIGYLPDFAFDPILGGILDANGNAGFGIIFSILIGIAIVGIISCLYVRRYVHKVENNEIQPFQLTEDKAA